MEDWAEQRFSFEPGHQRLTVNWIRVVKPNGEVVSAEPLHIRDSDVPATMGNPVYADRKVRRASLSGVAVGTIVDWSYTIEESKPYRPVDLLTGWSITTGLPTRRSRFIVDLPANVKPRLIERNLRNPAKITTAHGRRVHTWAAADLPESESEPLAADSNGVFQSVALVVHPDGHADEATLPEDPS